MAENGNGYRPIYGNDRVFVAGKTDSGKTFLTRNYLKRFPHVIVVDLKNNYDAEDLGAKVVTELRKIPTLPGGRFVYRPEWKYRNLDAWNFFYWACLERGNMIVNNDEVKLIVGDPARNIEGLTACMQMGRDPNNLGVWNTSQRPARLPVNLVSEAEHFFCFRMGHPDDRKLMAEVMETPAVRNGIDDEHGFWYYNHEMKEAAYYREAPRSWLEAKPGYLIERTAS